MKDPFSSAVSTRSAWSKVGEVLEKVLFVSLLVLELIVNALERVARHTIVAIVTNMNFIPLYSCIRLVYMYKVCMNVRPRLFRVCVCVSVYVCLR